MTVRLARLLVARRLAQTRNIPGFATTGSALPRTWKNAATAVNDTAVTAATPDLDLRAFGLAGLEESWRRDIPGDGDLDTWPQADVDRAPTWLDLAARFDSSARDARAATRQARHALISADVAGPGGAAVGGETAAAAVAAAALSKETSNKGVR